MTYITVKEASEKWNISTRRVCVLCGNGQVPGAIKKSKVWMIPINAQKPGDGRKNGNRRRTDPLSLLFNPTYFDNHALDEAAKEEKIIVEIQGKYLCGEFDEALSLIDRLINEGPDYGYLFVANVLKMIVASDSGRRYAYVEGDQSLRVLVSSDNYEPGKITFGLFRGNSDILANYYMLNQPEFYDAIPLITLLNGKRNINELIQSGQKMDITALEIICRELEEKNCPLIYAYYNLYLAVYCNAMNMNELFEEHIRQAAKILLPRGWYTPLAEYSASIDLEFIKVMDSEAYNSIQELSNRIVNNYIKAGMFGNLFASPRFPINENIKIAFMVAYGKSLAEISDIMGMSVYKVKQHIEDICQIIGTDAKKDIRLYLAKYFFV